MYLSIAGTFGLPAVVVLGGLVLIVILVVFVSIRGGQMPRVLNREPEAPLRRNGVFRFPQLPQLKWVMIPIVLGAVIASILIVNFYLNFSIHQYLYQSKAGIDWWGITYLNNSYFYAILGIGALLALSDPRLIIEKTPEGKKEYYLHSKFWGLVDAIRGQVYEFQSFSPFPTASSLGQQHDQISLKRGILWKFAEFAFGALIIAPSLAKEWALRFLLFSNWMNEQGISLIGLVQRIGGIFYGRFFLAQAPTGAWLIENSPVFEVLYWLRIPALLLGIIWGIRLFISFVLNIRAGIIFKSLRSLATIGLIALTVTMITMPTQAFDVTTPYFLRTVLIGWIILAALTVFFSIGDTRVQSTIGSIFRKKAILTALVLIISLSLLSGPLIVLVQINPEIQGKFVDYLWIPKYLPNVEFTRWATGVESIVEEDIQTAMNTGENLQILSNIRLFNRESAKTRLLPSIQFNWMDIGDPDIVNIGGNEYWISALTLIQPPGGDVWRSARLLLTHSEKVLGLNAHDGQILTNAAETVFGVNGTPQVYYGEDGLFASSPMVYVGLPNVANETHIDQLDQRKYSGDPDYVLTGFNRFWFFSGLFGQEQLRWDFGRGDYGDVNMLYLRDVSTRLSQMLLPGMVLDTDPYLVSDGSRLYYSFYVYLERSMPTEYLDYAHYVSSAQFFRLFANVLVDAYDGKITGYLLGTDEQNYVSDFYRSVYTLWDNVPPSWLVSQLRYPEFLFNKMIDAYNFYHVSDADKWQKNTDFFQLTTNSAGTVIEEVRFVTFSLDQQSMWAGVRLVEVFKGSGKNLAGVYVALNGEDLGRILLLRPGNIAIIGPQTAFDTINNFGSTKSLLTLNTNWVSGNTLSYVINGAIYYFIPYYARSETTLSPAMMTVVNALTQKVGFYVIFNPQDAVEVSTAAQKAYQNLVGQTVEVSAEARKQNVLNEFAAMNYTLRTPQELNPNVAFNEGEITYLLDSDFPAVQTLIDSFVSQFVQPLGTDTVLSWETLESGNSNLNFGVLSNKQGVVELHYIKITYAKS